MPVYEYSCSNCKLKFELLRPMSQSREIALCPSCGGNAQRLVSLFFSSSEGSAPFASRSICGSCSATTCSSCSLLR